jgi:hypothetical protein
MFPIFEKLGGKKAGVEALRAKAGKPNWPAQPTLARWEKNGELPGKAILLAMEICDDRGIAYRSTDFRAQACPEAGIGASA